MKSRWVVMSVLKGYGKHGKHTRGTDDDDDKELSGKSKQDWVFWPLEKRRVHMADGQEARPFRTGITTHGDFIVASSQADNDGVHGCMCVSSVPPFRGLS